MMIMIQIYDNIVCVYDRRVSDAAGNISWPLKIDPEIASSAWFDTLTAREKEASWFSTCRFARFYIFFGIFI